MNPAQKEAVDGAPVPPASASHPLRPPVPLPTPGNVEKFGVKTDGENDMEFWDRDSSALERVKEEMLNSRASNGLGGSNPDYRSLNRMASLEREHFIVDLSGSPKGSVASSPVLIPGQLWPVGSTSTSNSVSMSLAASVAPSMAPSAAMSVGSPGSPPNSLPGTLKRSTTRSKSLLVTASLAPNVSSADPASVIRRGTVKSNKAPSIAGVKRSGTLSRKPSKVKESFQWLDEDPDDSDSVDWNRKETKCTRCFSRWTSLPFLYRYLISNCLGILLLMLPGIINIIFFIENPYSYWVFFIPKKDANGNPIMTLGGFPVFFWSLWASISFFVASTLLYIVPYLPYLILRLAYLIVGKLDQFPITLVQFSRVLNGYIVFLMAASISSVAFGQMLPGATDIGATVAQLLSSTAGVAALWLGIKFGLAVFGVGCVFRGLRIPWY